MKDGSIVDVDFKNSQQCYEQMQAVNNDNVAGLITLVPASNQWCGEYTNEVSETFGYVVGVQDKMEAARNLINCKLSVEKAERELRSNPVAWLERELQHHDWTYMMSDDYRYYSAGLRHKMLIDELISKVDPAIVEGLWRKYAPPSR